jgi:hypothetical protein
MSQLETERAGELRDEPPVLITGSDLEKRLSISASHRRKLEEHGLPVYRLSPQVRRYDLQAVQAWLAARLQEGKTT